MLMEKRQFFNEMLTLCERLRITANEIELIRKDPNFLLPLWLMFKSTDSVLIMKILDELVENYNPKEWRGEKKTRIDEKPVKIMSMFPFPGEFRKLLDKYRLETLRGNDIPLSVSKKSQGDGDGLKGLKGHVLSSVEVYNKLSDGEKKEFSRLSIGEKEEFLGEKEGAV